MYSLSRIANCLSPTNTNVSSVIWLFLLSSTKLNKSSFVSLHPFNKLLDLFLRNNFITVTNGTQYCFSRFRAESFSELCLTVPTTKSSHRVYLLVAPLFLGNTWRLNFISANLLIIIDIWLMLYWTTLSLFLGRKFQLNL